LGETAEFVISYEARISSKNVVFAVAFVSSLGQRVCWISNEIAADPITVDSREGKVSCVVPSFPLVPGRYSLNVSCTSAGIICDWILDALQFEVLAADFYGSGKIATGGSGLFCLKHSWHQGICPEPHG
jgi:lipopolysaccharide transport system ATP-binding protein